MLILFCSVCFCLCLFFVCDCFFLSLIKSLFSLQFEFFLFNVGLMFVSHLFVGSCFLLCMLFVSRCSFGVSACCLVLL